MAARRWAEPAALLVAAALLLWAALAPHAVRGAFGEGANASLFTYDLALPLVGLGAALAPLRRWATLASLAFILGGAAVGVAAEHRVVSVILEAASESRRVLDYLASLGPLALVLAGLGLGLPQRIRAAVLPLLGAAAAAAVGAAIEYRDPTAGDPRFLGGALVAGSWLILAPRWALEWAPPRWLRIGGSIVASWLVAIGLLLGTSKLLTRRAAEPPPPAPTSLTLPSPDATPFDGGLRRPGLPGRPFGPDQP